MAQTALSGRIALVTGGARGIGKAIALALADAGCDVAVNLSAARRMQMRPATESARRAAARWPSEVMFRRVPMLPVGRFGRVEECGDVAVLLAGNPYITGQTIGVNGGMYLGS